MQGLQLNNSHASLKSESVWFKTKLVSQFLTLSFLLSQPFYLSYLHAAPVGGEVVGGTGSISKTDLTTTINQTSQNLAINWQSFNVNTNEKVNFIQPNSSSIALNRILGNNGSTIQGQINANGQVILVNPNGIFFTSTSIINVGGLVASSLDMTPSDFMNGNYIFNEVLGTNGAVVNSGIINASLGDSSSDEEPIGGGNVALIGKKVKNNGLISAVLGSVILAAGKQSVLTFDSQGLIGVKVTREVLQEEIGLEEAVINNGAINAAGGRVLLTASTSHDVFSQAVNTKKLDQATSVVVNDDGTFTLGGGADVLNTGSIDVSSESNANNTARIILLGENITSSGTIKADVQNGKAGEIEIHAKNKTLLTNNSITSAKALSSGQGGLIKVLGDKVGLLDSSLVDTSGVNGGGKVLIGGDQEGKNSLIRNAEFIYLSDQSKVKADATDNGDGGKVIAFAENSAKIHGQLFARGGVNGGNGGFIETSGLLGFQITSVPDASAYVGDNGTWLIDPFNITITGNTKNVNDDDPDFSYFDAILTGAEIDVDDIKMGLSNGDVIIRTTRTDGSTPVGTESGNIDINEDIDFNGIKNNKATLTLDADGDINLRTGKRIFDSSNPGEGDQLNLNLFARGNILLKLGSSINTYGGTVTIGDTANSIIPASFENNGTINTTGGTNQAGGKINITTLGTINNTSTGLLIANGGVADRDGAEAIIGQNGGSISLTSSTGVITIDGNITSQGTTGDYRDNRVPPPSVNGDGGAGGAITIKSTSGNILMGADVVISSIGANGSGDTGGGSNNNNDPAKGGAGGKIDISTGGTLNIAVLNTNGGSGIGGDSAGTTATGGKAGEIVLTGTTITLNNSLNANGGTTVSSSTRGDGNDITLTGNTVIAGTSTISATGSTNGNINFNGTLSATSINREDSLILQGKDITFKSDVGSTGKRFKDIEISATGDVKAETSTAPADRKDFYVDTLNVKASSSFTARDINANAMDDSASSLINSTTNTVFINSLNSINVGDVITYAGTSTAAGHNGGGIALAAQDITVGTLNSSGSNAVVADVNGGDAGVISVIATDNSANGTPSITLNGDLKSIGGTAIASGTGTAGASKNVLLTLKANFTGTGTLNIDSYVNDFSSQVTVTGSSGKDTLIASDRINNWVLTAKNAGILNEDISASTPNGLIFTRFEKIIGSTKTDTLTGRAVDNTWLVSGAGSGSVTNTNDSTEVMEFENINSLKGNSEVDDFIITGSLTGSIDGVGTNNSFTVDNGFDNTWNIDTKDGGNVLQGLAGDFSNIQKVKGGSNDDTFNIGMNGTVDLIEGGADTKNNSFGDIVNFISKTTGVDVVLGTVITASKTDINIDSVEQINADASATGKNILTGKDQDTSWNITGANSGDLDSTVYFNNFTDLNGGNQNDIFKLGVAGSLSGKINGNSHNLATSLAGDQIDFSLRENIILTINNSSGNTINYDGGTIKYTAVETVIGNNTNGSTSSVVGEDVNSTWTITGTDKGTVKQTALGGSITSFSNFNNITGGKANDNFQFQDSGFISGFVDGGGATTKDTVSMSGLTQAKKFSLSSTLAATAINIKNINEVVGDSGTTGFVTLVGSDLDNVWTISGDNRGKVVTGATTVDFRQIANITGGNLNDNFNFSAGSSGSIKIGGLIDGGEGVNTVDMSLLNDNFTVNVGTDITRINTIIGNAAAGTILVGANFDTSWNIDGTNTKGDLSYNDGTSNLSLDFSGFKNLQGNTSKDTFIITTTDNFNGSIDGGSGTEIDSVDYTRTKNAVIQLGGSLSGITGIEHVIGDNSSTKLVGLKDKLNEWVLDANNNIDDSVNDGLVNYDGNTLRFVNINILESGEKNDTFTISNGATFKGSILGNVGDNIVSVDLTGIQSGEILFDGKGGNNTLNITGDSDNGAGGTDYSGVYTSNVDSIKNDQFVYTNGLNAYRIKYSNVDVINDNLLANSLTVQGSFARDKITLNTSQFQVSTNFALATQNDAKAVNYSGKTNLIVDGMANDSDIIDIAGSIMLNGTLALKNSILTSATAFPLIKTNELLLDSISSTGTSETKKLNTDITHLSVVNSGNLYIREQNGINIAELNTVDLLDIVAIDGDITGIDRALLNTNANLVSSGTINFVTQNGNILLNGDNQLSGELNFSTTSGNSNNVELRNTTNTRLNKITTENLTVVTTGTNSHISQFDASSVITSAGLTRISSSGNVDFSNVANNFTRFGVDSAQNVIVKDANDIGLTTINASSVDIEVVGEIFDSNADNPADNIIASTLKLRAGTGIGNNNALETSVSSIDAITTSGQLNIDNVGNVSLTNLVVVNSGNIDFNNQGNVEIGNVDAGYGDRTTGTTGGTFSMTVVGGSVTGKASTTYLADPDITAYNANIIVPGGTFGSRGRPISVHINNEFNLFSLQSAVKYIGEPIFKNDTSTAKISITDAFSSLAGQQLIEVESIGDVDPAIFTDVRNYSYSDLALMMPSDQRYDTSDEEEEEYEKEKRNKLINSEK